MGTLSDHLTHLSSTLICMSESTLSTWLEREIRKRGNLSTFAEEIGTSPSVVSRWVRGERRPSPRHCDNIADVLMVDRDFVLDLAGYRPTEEKFAPDDLREKIAQRVRRVNLGFQLTAT